MIYLRKKVIDLGQYPWFTQELDFNLSKLISCFYSNFLWTLLPNTVLKKVRILLNMKENLKLDGKRKP